MIRIQIPGKKNGRKETHHQYGIRTLEGWSCRFESIDWERSFLYLTEVVRKQCAQKAVIHGREQLPIALAVKTLGLGASVSSVHLRSAGQRTPRFVPEKRLA